MPFLRVETAKYDASRDDAVFGAEINAVINGELAEHPELSYAVASRDKTPGRIVVVGVFDTKEHADAGFPLTEATRDRLGNAGFEPGTEEVLEIGNEHIGSTS